MKERTNLPFETMIADESGQIRLQLDGVLSLVPGFYRMDYFVQVTQEKTGTVRVTPVLNGEGQSFFGASATSTRKEQAIALTRSFIVQIREGFPLVFFNFEPPNSDASALVEITVERLNR